MTNNVTDNISNDLPAIYRAEKLQQNAAQYGFDWVESSDIVKKIEEELYEVIDVLHDKSKLSEELGDLIFASLDVSRKLNMNPEVILSKSNNKFIKRWKKIELFIKNDDKNFNELKLKDLNKYWEKAKN